MKKLFALLLMLTVSLGSWAYSGKFEGVSFQDIGSDTQFIELSVGGSLDAWKTADTDGIQQGYLASNTSRTKLVITGPMTASDFSALTGSAWNKFTTVDLSKVTVTDPSYISNMTLANAQTIILPNGLTKEQIANLKNEASGVVAGLVGTSETAYADHYYYTLPGESEQEYTGTVSGSEGNYYFHETKTYQRPLTLQNDYPTFSWTDLLGETHDLTKEEVNYPDNTKTSWIPENVQVQLQETITSTTTITYTYNYTQDGQTYSFDLGNNLDKINTVTEDFTGTETTVKETFTYWTNNGSLGNYGNITISANDPVQVTITTTTTESYKYHHLTDTWDHWLDFNKTNDNFTRIDNVPIGTITNGGNNGTKEFPITAAFKYDYTDIRNNPLQYPAEGTLPAADDDGFVDWVFDEDVALRKVQIPYNNLTDVEGMVAYVNTAGALSSVASTIYDSSVKTQYRGAKNINILGNVNNSDLTELSETNYGSVEFLNIADVTVASGSSITSLDAKGTAAILLPSTVTEAELGTLQAKTVTENHVSVQKYHCLAYFKDKKNFNIYAFDGAVGKLGAVVDPGVTAITFIPRYDTNGVFYSADNEHGFIGRSSDEMNQFRAQLKNLPAISMDLSILNQKYMLADFREYGLSPYTHYLTLFGNVDPGSSVKYRANYDFTNENSTAIKYPSTVWVVSTFKVDEAHAFVLDEAGNKILISGSEEEGNAVYQRTGAATNVHYGGSQFLAATEPTNLVYVRDHDIVTAAEGEEVPSSLLEGAKNYFHGDQLYATRQIFMGDLNENEIAAIDNDIHGDYFDFMYGANFTQTGTTVGDNTLESIANLDNDNVKYILLPDNHEYNINATNTDNCSFSTCSNLLCVGAYNTTTNTLTTWSSAAGNVYAVTSKIRPQKTGRGTGLVCASLNNVVMSGKLNLADISAGTGNGLDNGLEGAVVKNADLSKAYFPNQEDMVFCPQYSAGGASWDKNIETLLLPSDSRQTLIPAHSLHGSANLNELCVPYNYETIGEDAFGLMGAKIITTTDKDGNLIIAGRQYKETDAEGNLIDIDGEIIPNKGLNTFSLSSNLQSIGTMAFWTGNKGLRDVYVLATKAPKCAADAFNSENYCGNIGFEGNFKHPITRDNYHNGDDIWYTILHFPSDINVNEAKKYTDITREYSLIDETSAFDGKGQLKHWPNHSEISRAYDQALSGVIWNDWPYMTEADYQITLGALPAVLKAKGYTEEEAAAYVDHYRKLGYEGSMYELRVTDGGNEDGIGTIPDGTITATYYKELQEGVTPQTCDFYDYIGWHQFVLTDYYRYEEIEVDDTPKNYTKLDYYTLCFPYDLTRQEVIDLIGAPNKNGNTLNGQALTEDAFPEVYTLKSVIRNQQTQHIDLGFSKELMAIAKTGKEITVTKDGWNYDNTLTTNNKKAGDDKAIFLKGGYPYLVRPIVPEGTSFSNLAEYMMSISDLTADDLGYQKVTSGGAYISVPYSSQGVISKDEKKNQLKWTDEDGNEQDYYYFFQGTYENEDLPKYAYYLGQKNGKRSFFYDTTGTRKWNRFSAIIGGRCPKDNAITYIGFDHGTSSKTVSTVTILMRNADDSFNPANNDVKVNFTFEGEDGFDETVAIESINGEAVNSAVEGDVYSVTGQFVGKSVNGLSKGLYIVNGKKVMVK